MINKQLFPQIYFLELVISEVARSRRRGYALSFIALNVQFAPEVAADRRARAHSAVAAHLLERVRLSDYASRFQGDTYLVLMPETSDLAAPLVEERIREGLAEMLGGEARIATARRTWSWEPTQELPDLVALQRDLGVLLEEVTPRAERPLRVA